MRPADIKNSDFFLSENPVQNIFFKCIDVVGIYALKKKCANDMGSKLIPDHM